MVGHLHQEPAVTLTLDTQQRKKFFLIFTKIEGAENLIGLALEKMYLLLKLNHLSNKEAWKSFLGQLECLDH